MKTCYQLRGPRFAGFYSIAALAGAGVFMLPKEAREWMVQEQAVVLDARGRKADAPYLPGARTVDWRDARDGWFRSGRLTSDIARLRRSFEQRGVDADRPVLVYGDMAEGWGEEGRIWWTLRYLGHSDVRILDGGIPAWRRAGLPVQERPARALSAGRLEPRVVPGLRASTAELVERADSTVVLDVRTREEFEGARPHFSARGGHIPGALHIPWNAFISEEGTLKAAGELRAMLSGIGVSRDADIVLYCTGGVRSAFAHAALMHAGFMQVKNYDASWWEWSSHRDLPIER